MTIRPIRNDEDHAAALREVELLWDATEGTEAADQLDVLTTLIETYEESRWPIRSADPVETLRFAMTDMGRSQNDLARILGSRSRASEVMNRRRALNVEMIFKISEAWQIPADMLVRPYALANRSSTEEKPPSVRKRSRAV